MSEITGRSVYCQTVRVLPQLSEPTRPTHLIASVGQSKKRYFLDYHPPKAQRLAACLLARFGAITQCFSGPSGAAQLDFYFGDLRLDIRDELALLFARFVHRKFLAANLYGELSRSSRTNQITN